MKCLVPSYYLCHTFLVFSYVILRRHLIQCGNGDFFSQTGKMTEDLLTREQEIWVVAFIIYFMKCRKVVTIQQLADITFFYGKLAAAVSLFLASKTFGSAYITVLISSLLFIRPRQFEDEESIQELTAVTFEERVKSPPKGSPDSRTLWMVIFYADWCKKAAHLYPLFAKLSMKNPDPERRKWAKVDVGQFPSIAKEFAIDTNPMTTRQIPTIVAFYKGKEERRLPLFNSSSNIIECAFSEQTLVKVFDLNAKVNTIRTRRRGEAQIGKLVPS